MVVCNLCRENKPIDDIQPSFKYVCKSCWDKLEIKIDGENIDKDLMY